MFEALGTICGTLMKQNRKTQVELCIFVKGANEYIDENDSLITPL